MQDRERERERERERGLRVVYDVTQGRKGEASHHIAISLGSITGSTHTLALFLSCEGRWCEDVKCDMKCMCAASDVKQYTRSLMWSNTLALWCEAIHSLWCEAIHSLSPYDVKQEMSHHIDVKHMMWSKRERGNMKGRGYMVWCEAERLYGMMWSKRERGNSIEVKVSKKATSCYHWCDASHHIAFLLHIIESEVTWYF